MMEINFFYNYQKQKTMEKGNVLLIRGLNGRVGKENSDIEETKIKMVNPEVFK